MAKRKTNIKWGKVCRRYVEGTKTFVEIARDLRCALKTVQRHANKGHWQQARETFRSGNAPPAPPAPPKKDITPPKEEEPGGKPMLIIYDERVFWELMGFDAAVA